MNYLKILLLFVSCVQLNSLIGGANHTRPVETDPMLKTVKKILDTEIVLVPTDFNLKMSNNEFDTFITHNTNTHDDPALLRSHFLKGRAEGLLYSRCRLPGKVDKQTPVILGRLLCYITDQELKKNIVTKVTDHISRRSILLASAPRGTHNTLAFFLDASQEMIERVCVESAAYAVTTPAQQP